MQLLVWAKEGISNQGQFEDVNNGHLVYEHQRLIEYLEHTYILYRKIYDNSLITGDVEQTLFSREYMLILEQSIRESTNFGEIRGLILEGMNEMNLNNLKSSINERLSIKESLLKYNKDRKNNKFNTILIILFGLISVPQLSEFIIDPMWRKLKFWLSTSVEDQSLFLIVISSIILTCFILVFYFVNVRKIKK